MMNYSQLKMKWGIFQLLLLKCHHINLGHFMHIYSLFISGDLCKMVDSCR